MSSLVSPLLATRLVERFTHFDRLQHSLRHSHPFLPTRPRLLNSSFNFLLRLTHFLLFRFDVRRVEYKQIHSVMESRVER